jgi:hypothetical protein
MFNDVETAAKCYVEAIMSPPDGLGVHFHKASGYSSQYIMFRMTRVFGSDETQEAIKKELKNYGEKTKRTAEGA